MATAWENLTEQEANKWLNFSWDHQYRQNLATLMMEFSEAGSATILDVGCSHGQYIRKLRSMGYRGQYKGLDISKMFIEIAEKANPGEFFQIQDINEIKEANESHHLVVSAHVVDHLFILKRPMWELFRVAKRYVILGTMFSNGDTTIKHDYDFINHCYSMAEIFSNVPLGWTPVKSAVFHPEWDRSVNILQCVWKRQ